MNLPWPSLSIRKRTAGSQTAPSPRPQRPVVAVPAINTDVRTGHEPPPRPERPVVAVLEINTDGLAGPPMPAIKTDARTGRSVLVIETDEVTQHKPPPRPERPKIPVLVIRKDKVTGLPVPVIETDDKPPPQRPTVHVSWSGVFSVDEKELFESEVGQRILREAEELEKRLRGKPSTGAVAPTAPDRTPAGD